jgi:hypothetical protein
MSLPPSVQAHIDELKSVINAGRPFLGGSFIDEQAFFIATSRLKKTLADALTGVERDVVRGMAVVKLIDEFEMLIEMEKVICSAKFGVNKQACLNQIDAIQAAFPADLKRAEQLQQVHQAEDKRVLAEAHAEAARIVDEAHREAAGIIKEARDKASLGIGL